MNNLSLLLLTAFLTASAQSIADERPLAFNKTVAPGSETTYADLIRLICP